MSSSRGLDPETAKAMTRGETLRGLLNSEGWAIAKEILYKRIKTLDSISSLPVNVSPEQVGLEAMYRNHAIALVLDWVGEIEGEVEQFQEQTRVLAEMRTDEIIREYSSPS